MWIQRSIVILVCLLLITSILRFTHILHHALADTVLLWAMGIVIFTLALVSILLLRETVDLRRNLLHYLEHLARIERVSGIAQWRYVTGTHTLVLSENARIVLGYPEGSIRTADDFIRHVHPEDRESVQEWFSEDSDVPSTMNCRFIHPTGDIIYLEVFSEPMLDRQHRKIGLLGILRDVTAYRHREQALVESREKTQRALTLADMYEWEMDYETRTIRVSEHIGARLFMEPGRYIFTFDEFLARVDPSNREMFLNFFTDRQSGAGSAREIEFKFNRADGEVFYIRSFGSAIRDERGLICRRFGISQDITNLRQAESALRESEYEKNFVIDSIDLGLALMTPDRRLIWSNRAIGTLFDSENSDPALNTLCYQKHARRREPCVNCPVPEALMMRQKATREITHGDRVLSITTVPSMNEYDEIVRIINIVQDVTEQKNLQQQLMRSQRMEAIGRMAGGIAHDFNNILHVIQGYSEFLDDVEDPEIRAMLKPIIDAAAKGRSLVRNLMTFSNSQTDYSLQFVNLSQTLPSFKEWVERTLGETIEVSLSVEDSLPGIMVDPGLFDQIMLNLCFNAKDAMPDGGRIHIETGVTALNGTEPEMAPGMETGDYVTVSVSDTGSGIPESHLKWVFDPFFTSRQGESSSGLGLSTVYAVMQKHRGTVSVSSTEGEGSTFILYFPVPQEDSLDTDEWTLAFGEKLREENSTVLLVEDDPMVRKITRKTLEKAGFQVIPASDGQGAIDRFAEASDTIDLVLLDVVLPRRSGREVYHFIHHVRPDIPIVFVTGYAADYLEGIPGDSVLLRKPYAGRELLRVIRRCIRETTDSPSNQNTDISS